MFGKRGVLPGLGSLQPMLILLLLGARARLDPQQLMP